MTTANPPTLDQARLIAWIAEELAEATPTPAAPAEFTLPALTDGTWVDDLPLSWKDLYGDDDRC